jgi:hypothetical protein
VAFDGLNTGIKRCDAKTVRLTSDRLIPARGTGGGGGDDNPESDHPEKTKAKADKNKTQLKRVTRAFVNSILTSSLN